MGRPIRIQFPLGGINRRLALQSQPPYTTPDCLNVRPRALEGRTRGGTRPGLSRMPAADFILGNNTATAGTGAGLGFIGPGAGESWQSWTLATATMHDYHIGLYLRFAATGNKYLIKDIVGTNVVVLMGRPGLVEASADNFTIDTGAPVRMLTELHVLPAASTSSINLVGAAGNYEDNFNFLHDQIALGQFPLASEWAQAAWSSAPVYIREFTRPGVSLDRNYWAAKVGGTGGASTRTLLAMDLTKPYTVTLTCDPVLNCERGVSPDGTAGWSGLQDKQWSIALSMNNAAPNYTVDGVVVGIRALNSNEFPTYIIELTEYIGGVAGTTRSAQVLGMTSPFDFSVTVDPPAANNLYTVCIDGFPYLTFLGTAAAAGSRFGFGLAAPVLECHARTFKVNYFQVPTVPGANVSLGAPEQKPVMVASAGGYLYADTASGPLVRYTGNGIKLKADRLLQACEIKGKLYIADYDEPVLYGTGATVTGAGTTFDHASVADWRNWNIDQIQHVVSIFNVSAGTVAGTYALTAAAIIAANLVLATSATNGNCDFQIRRPPKIYDPQAAAASQLSFLMATKGIAPLGCPLIAAYQERLVLAGNPGNIWYMSRQGDPLDWLYGGDLGDSGRAIAGTVFDRGRVPDPLTAMIVGDDDRMTFGCAESMWNLLGNPAAGGQIVNASRKVGPIAPGAWCMTPENFALLLTRGGMYAFSPGGRPESISFNSIPSDLRDIDVAQNTLLMEYDVRDRGAHLFITPTAAGGASQHWWFDWIDKTWWPVTFAKTGKSPTSICTFKPTARPERLVMLGGYDGFVRYFDEKNNTDDGDDLENYVMIGPIMPGGEMYDGIIDQIDATLDKDGGSVAWSIHTGDSPEDALNATAIYSGVWTAGSNYRERPAIRGSAIFLKLSGTGTAWAYESIIALVERAGRHRKP